MTSKSKNKLSDSDLEVLHQEELAWRTRQESRKRITLEEWTFFGTQSNGSVLASDRLAELDALVRAGK